MKDNPFRSRKIHGYHPDKQDASKGILRTGSLVASFLVILRVAIVAVMLLIAQYEPTVKGSMDFLYHLVDDLAWFATGLFLFVYHKNHIGYPYYMHLERISHLAFFVAIASVVVTIVYGVFQTAEYYWLFIYYSFTAVAWAVLAVFFYAYWKHIKRANHHREGQDK